jgi:hypothetical protein
VVTRDGDGNVVGVGTLGEGQTVFSDESGTTDVFCVLEFEIDLTGAAPFYTAEIAGRGRPTYTHADMEALDWRVELMLG